MGIEDNITEDVELESLVQDTDKEYNEIYNEGDIYDSCKTYIKILNYAETFIYILFIIGAIAGFSYFLGLYEGPKRYSDYGFVETNCYVTSDNETSIYIEIKNTNETCQYGIGWNNNFDEIGEHICYVNPNYKYQCQSLQSTNAIYWDPYILHLIVCFIIVVVVSFFSMPVFAAIKSGIKMIACAKHPKDKLFGMYVLCLLGMLVGSFMFFFIVMDIRSPYTDDLTTEGYIASSCDIVPLDQHSYEIKINNGPTCEYSHNDKNFNKKTKTQTCYYDKYNVNVCDTVSTSRYKVNVTYEAVKLALYVFVSVGIPVSIITSFWILFTRRMRN